MPKFVMDNESNIWELLGTPGEVKRLRNVSTNVVKSIMDFNVGVQLFEIAQGSPANTYNVVVGDLVKIKAGQDEFEQDIFINGEVVHKGLLEMDNTEGLVAVLVAAPIKDVFRRGM